MGLSFTMWLLILLNCEQTTKLHVGLANLQSADSIWTHFEDSAD